MITAVHTYKCRRCGSDRLIRYGKNSYGNPKYKCKDCQHAGVFESKRKSEAFKETVVKASLERASSRGLARTFGISHQTVLDWIKKSKHVDRSPTHIST